MMEAACTSETSVDNYFTRQYIPEDNSELPLLIGQSPPHSANVGHDHPHSNFLQRGLEDVGLYNGLHILIPSDFWLWGKIKEHVWNKVNGDMLRPYTNFMN